ncbi:MAG: ATP-binding protein [Pseudohongiella sp.]|nr:ATP-binding protein [Pseudohongiella sp.]MDO9520760.1 ATP-binding protein [Pseudohongiella sp.]MDP2126955.1 ATP-binding protein [Pseudohongiella sp.]
MISIRWFLTLTLIALIVLVSFLSSLRGYRESMSEAEILFDLQLLEHVKLLGLLNPASYLEGNALVLDDNIVLTSAEVELSSQLEVVYQIFDRDGRLVIRSESSPVENMAAFESGYQQAEFNNYQWRALVAQDPRDGHWVMAAQRSDVRYRLAETVTLQAVLPSVLAVPIAGLLIWLIVGVGLRPIQILAAVVRARETSDLRPVELHDVPRELTPLTQSTNELLMRLALAFDREKRFAADAAHELRTPISILKVQLHNILHDLHEKKTAREDHDKSAESLREIGEGIDRLAKLIEQILILNRTSPDQYMQSFSRMDLLVLARDVVSSEFEQILARDQVFSLTGESAIIVGDVTALRSLVQNLLINASKYTPVGGQISLSVTNEQNLVVLRFEDSGPGIPECEYSRVFDRFYRLGGDHHDPSVSGSGLGLAIVKHIAEMHEADIQFSRSASLGGLCVTVSFPLNNVERGK